MMAFAQVAKVIDQEADIVGDAEAAARCAATTFLITAAAATAVEIVARRIHAASLPAGSPFVHVSAAVLPTDAAAFAETCGNLLDKARGGSLLLTNVEDLPAVIQDSLIETLAELQGARDSPAAVRLIAGTTAILHDCVAKGTFSERLFYRLNIIHIVIAGFAAPCTEPSRVAGSGRLPS